jgi:hypothetical protein
MPRLGCDEGMKNEACTGVATRLKVFKCWQCCLSNWQRSSSCHVWNITIKTLAIHRTFDVLHNMKSFEIERTNIRRGLNIPPGLGEKGHVDTVVQNKSYQN